MSSMRKYKCAANISLSIDTKVPHTEEDVRHRIDHMYHKWSIVSLPCKHLAVAQCGRGCIYSYCDEHIDNHYCGYQDASIAGGGYCQGRNKNQKAYWADEMKTVVKSRPICDEKSKFTTCSDCRHCYCETHYAEHKCAFL